MRRAGMSPPEFDAHPGRLTVTVPRTALLSPETVNWIQGLQLQGLTDAQHLALAIMRSTGRVSVGILNSWGVTEADARRAVKDLVNRGVAIRTGGRRYPAYQLVGDIEPHLASQPLLPTFNDGEHHHDDLEPQLAAIIQAIDAGHDRSRDLAKILGVSYPTVLRRLKTLEDRGLVEPTQPRQSSKQSYRVVR